MLTRDNAALVVIDVQEKLMRVIHERDALVAQLEKLIQGIRALDVPIVWVEQNPQGLGPTVSAVAQHLEGIAAISKLSFSCCGTHEFADAVDKLARHQIILCGIETHVCVYQTAMDLIQFGHEVEVVADAVSSRTPRNKATALRKLERAGVGITSTEMLLFELLQAAEGPAFKQILRIVK